MIDPTEAYRSRLLSHEELLSKIQANDTLAFGSWMGQPHGFMRSLVKAGPKLDPLFVITTPASGVGELLNQSNIICLTSFMGPFERAAQRQQRNVFYTPTQYADAYRAVRTNAPPNFVIVRAAPMDASGYFNLSLSSSWTNDGLRYFFRNSPATRIVLEINKHMPRVCGLKQFGNNELHITEVHYLIEDDSPLPSYTVPEPNEVERAIAANVARLVEDRATIQLGIGTIPMGIGRLLTERKELGIHTELFCQSHVDLIEAGCVTNAHKGLFDGVSVATFALGEEKLYRWLENNPKVAMVPVEEINPVGVLARIQRMTSINGILTIDLSGQACAHCLGPQTYSGLGGAFEFAFGAQQSPGGKSIVCLPSKTRLKDGREVSNILPRHEAGVRITLPEHCVDWVVTEYGAVRLKFLNLEFRALALIEIAHPQFREELTRQAVANGLNLSGVSRLHKPLEKFFSRER
jgi:acyl-CoA hydrolase